MTSRSSTLLRPGLVAAAVIAVATASTAVHAATATFPVGTTCSVDVIPACEPDLTPNLVRSRIRVRG